MKRFLLKLFAKKPQVVAQSTVAFAEFCKQNPSAPSCKIFDC
jgi:hypothetical protein